MVPGVVLVRTLFVLQCKGVASGRPASTNRVDRTYLIHSATFFYILAIAFILQRNFIASFAKYVELSADNHCAFRVFRQGSELSGIA